MVNFDKKFWKNKKILVTGHTGFTGIWLVSILDLLGCKIYGLSLHKNFNRSLFKRSNLKIKEYFFDISKKDKTNLLIKKIKPDLIFHLAAQSLVKKGMIDTYSTYNSNYVGTLNILNSISTFKKKISLIVATTDKVYNNEETSKFFVEEDKLDATDPYSASKVAQDILSTSYYFSKLKNKKNFSVAILRAGNIIGGGDLNDFRLLPDFIKYIYERKKLKIRGYNSVRPWQHIIQVCYGYMLVAEKITKNVSLSGVYNIGPFERTFKVRDIIKIIMKHYKIKKAIPIEKNVNFKEKKILLLNSNKAKKFFGYNQIIHLPKALDLTLKWYDGYFKKKPINKLINSDLKKFFNF